MSNVPRSMGALRQKYLTNTRAIERFKEKAADSIEGVVKTLEIQAAAFVFGAVQGAWYEPDPKVPGDKPGLHWFGMPVEAVCGIGLTIGGFLGFAGDKWSTHMLNLGNGAMAAWTSNLGRGWGFKFRKEQQARKAGGSVKGADLRDEIASLLEE